MVRRVRSLGGGGGKELNREGERTDWGRRGEEQSRNSRSICERHQELSLSVWGENHKEPNSERPEQNYFGKKDSVKAVRTRRESCNLIELRNYYWEQAGSHSEPADERFHIIAVEG